MTNTQLCLLGKDRERSRSPQRQHKVDNIGMIAKNRLKNISIQKKLTALKSTSSPKPKMSVATAFNLDSDDEPEEMPPEARMRMRNIGRDTPTSSGPNSFGKTKHGFSDAKKLFEKNLKDAMDSALADD